jgi:hypothetical protein
VRLAVRVDVLEQQLAGQVLAMPEDGGEVSIGHADLAHHPGLASTSESNAFASDPCVPVPQRRQPERLIEAGVFLVPDSEECQLQQPDQRRDDLVAGESAGAEITAGAPPDPRQGLPEPDHPLELVRIPTRSEAHVVAVLLSATGVAPGRLEMAVRSGGDPDVGPCRRNRQGTNPFEGWRIGHPSSRRLQVREAVAARTAGDAGTIGGDVAQAGSDRVLPRRGGVLGNHLQVDPDRARPRRSVIPRVVPPEAMHVLDWLLESDPAIRWQALRDLTDAPAEAGVAERARVATEGWGAQLLALRRDDGQWDIGKPDTEWITLLALHLLRDMGLDPASGEARAAIERVRDMKWHNPWAEWNGGRVFDGEVEPCINGRIVAIGAYFGVGVDGIVARLLGEQMADGGWNCEQENGSTRGSFHTTANVLEGLLEHQRAGGGSVELTMTVARGQEYLLERGLLRRLSTGGLIEPDFGRFSYPTGWHYDVLRGLEYLRDGGVTPDARLAEGIELVRSKRDADGRWPLENPHESEMVNSRVRDLGFDMDEGEGRPSRWNTLRAMRVLAWYERGS